MSARKAALAGLVFVVIAGFYYAFAAVVEPVHVDFAGVTMLIALGAAMAIMGYVLLAGSRQG